MFVRPKTGHLSKLGKQSVLWLVCAFPFFCAPGLTAFALSFPVLNCSVLAFVDTVCFYLFRQISLSRDHSRFFSLALSLFVEEAFRPRYARIQQVMSPAQAAQPAVAPFLLTKIPLAIHPVHASPGKLGGRSLKTAETPDAKSNSPALRYFGAPENLLMDLEPPITR